MRVLRIDATTHVVVNAELWDIIPPDGEFVFVANDDAHIGDVYDEDTKTFSAAPAPAAPVPSEVSMLQARVALAKAGLLAQVQAAVDAAPADSEVAIYWEYAASLQRLHPVVTQLAAALSLSDLEVDDLFRAAAQVV